MGTHDQGDGRQGDGSRCDHRADDASHRADPSMSGSRPPLQLPVVVVRGVDIAPALVHFPEARLDLVVGPSATALASSTALLGRHFARMSRLAIRRMPLDEGRANWGSESPWQSPTRRPARAPCRLRECPMLPSLFLLRTQSGPRSGIRRTKVRSERLRRSSLRATVRRWRPRTPACCDRTRHWTCLGRSGPFRDDW